LTLIRNDVITFLQEHVHRLFWAIPEIQDLDMKAVPPYFDTAQLSFDTDPHQGQDQDGDTAPCSRHTRDENLMRGMSLTLATRRLVGILVS
jgi:hypothetical protein